MDVISVCGHFFQVSELPALVSQLSRGALTWSDVRVFRSLQLKKRLFN